MGRRHLTAAELNEMYRVKAQVEEEWKKQRRSLKDDEEINRAIRATHLADMIIQTIVLIDHFDADREWVDEFLQLQMELLEQYDDGIVELKQMKEHIKAKIGVDIDAYSKKCMAMAGFPEEKDG